MDSGRISQLAQQNSVLRHVWRGAYARDTFPQGPLVAGAYVINTDVSSGAGEHWVSVSKSGEGDESRVDFFDSLGRPPSFYGMRFNERNAILFNDVRVQAPSTKTCALYCLFFLFWKSSGATMEEIISSFSADTAKNEEAMKTFAAILFSHVVI